MTGKTKKKKGIRFWRRKKRMDDAEDHIESDYAPPTLSRTHVKQKSSATTSTSTSTVANSIDTSTDYQNTSPRQNAKIKSGQRQRSMPRPRQPVVSDFDPIEDVSYKHADTYRDRKRDAAPRTPSQKIKISDTFTPRTVGSGTLTPSPTKWQESDKDTKLQYMARLHQVSQEHVKQSTPKNKKNKKLPNIRRPGVIPPAWGSSTDRNNREDDNGPAEDKKFIDTILGASPSCVPSETASVIKDYASKPTSPATVVNFAMLKKGSMKVAELAKDSMKHLMTCAADLNDFKNDSEIGKDLCYAFEHPDETFGGTFDDDDDDTYSYERRQRGRSRSRREGYNSSYDTGDDGTFTGEALNIGKDRGASPLTVSASEVTNDDDDESLGEVMGRMQRGDNRYIHKEPAAEPRYSAHNPVVSQPFKSEPPIVRLGASSRTSKIHKAASQASGLTSFRDFTAESSSRSMDGSQKHVTNGTLSMADPRTKNVPFDEGSESELRRAGVLATSPTQGDQAIAGDPQLAETHASHVVDSQHHQSYMEVQPENSRKYLLRFEDESIDVDEVEV